MMEKVRLSRSAAVLAAAMMAFAAPAAAATSTLRMWTTQAAIVGLTGDPAVVAASCPAGFAERGALVISSQETVQVESAVYSGTMHSITDQHCSVPRPPMSTWADGTRKVTPIQMEAGHLVLATPAGDELFVDYRGPGVIKGELFGANTHTFNGPYTVTGGTGIFEGATGHGSLTGEVHATATGFTGGWALHGSISVPD